MSLRLRRGARGLHQRPNDGAARELDLEAIMRIGSCALQQEILHCGQSQWTDLVGGKPLGLTIAWINRRGVALAPEVPRPDYIFSDIASVVGLLD